MYLCVFERKIRTRLDLLSIPQSEGENVKTFRCDHRCIICSVNCYSSSINSSK